MSAPATTPEVHVDRGVTVVVLGQPYQLIDEHLLDAGLRESLLEIAESADPPVVLLDLTETRFFGSSFIEVLFRMWNRLQTKPAGNFAICGLTPYCLEVLKITHLDTLWRIFPQRGEAVRALEAAAH